MSKDQNEKQRIVPTKKTKQIIPTEMACVRKLRSFVASGNNIVKTAEHSAIQGKTGILVMKLPVRIVFKA
jgi:hypothetical protein